MTRRPGRAGGAVSEFPFPAFGVLNRVMEIAAARRPFPGAVIFAITALVSLGLGGLMAVRAPLFSAGALTAYAHAWIYLMIFGFGCSAVFAAVYAALPSAFGVRLQSRQAVYIHYLLHLAGLAVLLLAPFVPDLPQGRLVWILLGCGAVMFLWNAGSSLRRMARPDAASAFVVTAGLWLLAAVLVGLPVSGAAHFQFLAGTTWMSGWFPFVVAGVFFNTLFALALRLLPPHLPPESPHEAVAWFAFAITNLGVSWSFAAATVGARSLLLGTSCIFAAGAIILTWEALDLFRQRRGAFGFHRRMLAVATCLVPFAVVLFILRASRDAGSIPPVPEEAPAVADLLPPPEIAVSSLDWATGIFALLFVAAPGLLAGIFALLATGVPGRATRLRGVSLAVYAAGAVMLAIGAGASKAMMFSLGGGCLGLAAGGILADLLAGVRGAQTLPATGPERQGVFATASGESERM